MNKFGTIKRPVAWMLVSALTLSTVFNNGITAQAASANKVKSVTLKIGSKKVNKKTVTLEKGKKASIKVSVSPAKAKKSVSFKSSKKAIASVTKKGKVTAKSAGTAKITVTVTGKDKKKKSAWVKIKVTEPQQATTQQSATLQPTTQKPTTQQPATTVTPATTEKQGTTEKQSATEQQATTAEDEQKTTEAPAEVEAVELKADPAEIHVGKSTTVSAVFSPEGSSSAMSWKSSDEEIAVVNEAGSVTGLKNGEVTITGTTANGKTATIKITVNSVAVTGISLDQTELKLNAGASATLNATVAPEEATNRIVTWSTSDENVAKVDGNGVVTAGSQAGTATITATTSDMGFEATCTVVVSAETNEDVDGVKASVSNSLTGYEGMVLVGTDARIDFSVTKNGTAIKNETVAVSLEPVSGYGSYYELSNKEVNTGDGVGTVYVRLKDQYRSTCKAQLYDGTDDAATQPAYATFNLTINAGGANYTKMIPVSFGQVVISTQYGVDHNSYAITVDNQYDPLLKKIAPSDSKITATRTAYSEDGYNEQYVVSQQVSSTAYDDSDHRVYLDAAPLLYRASEKDAVQKDIFEKDVNKGQADYTVYKDENDQDVVLLEDVPGGLQYLNLTCSKFQLSKYTHLVVRAYYPDTMVPITYEETVNGVTTTVVAEKIFEHTIKLTGSNLPIGQEVFNSATKNMRAIDLRIFIESAGQVNAGSNGGFEVTKVSGKYENENRKEYEIVRLDKTVTWTKGSTHNGYTASDEMSASVAKSLLGSNYNANNKYYLGVPSYPETGNAIIRVYDKNDNLVEYFMYPTQVEEKKNVLVTSLTGKFISRYLFHATADEVKELAETDYDWTVDETTGRVIIDSKKAGYVPVKASIEFGETNNKVKYDVYSNVQWSPIPENKIEPIDDFYALTGQKVTITAEVKDSEGNVKSADVTWKYNNEELDTQALSDLGAIVSKIDRTSDSDGKAILMLKSNQALDLEKITAESGGSNYVVTLKVKGQAVTTKGFKLHWIQPGIYYQNELSGIEVDTTAAENALNEALAKLQKSPSQYKTTETWILGTKLVGKAADSSIYVKSISDLKLSAEPSSDTLEVDVKELADGVWSLTNTKIGSAELKVSLDGFAEGKDTCSFEIEKDGETKTYVNVGVDDIVSNALTIPMNWVVSGANLTLINTNPTFDVDNVKLGTDIVPHVYAQVLDDQGNPVKGTGLTLTVTSDKSGVIVDGETKGIKTDENGLYDIDLSKVVEELPTQADTYTVSVFITAEGDKENVKTTTIKFTKNDTKFALVEKTDKVNPIVVDANAGTITLTFTREVDAASLNKSFFSVKDDQGSNVKSFAVERNSKNNKQVVITVENMKNADMTVVIAPKYEKDNQVYYFLDKDGVLYSDGSEAGAQTPETPGNNPEP